MAWIVSFPSANQSLISQVFLSFLLIQKLFCGNPSVSVLLLWQMAWHWQLYTANLILCSSDAQTSADFINVLCDRDPSASESRSWGSAFATFTVYSPISAISSYFPVGWERNAREQNPSSLLSRVFTVTQQRGSCAIPSHSAAGCKSRYMTMSSSVIVASLCHKIGFCFVSGF